MKRIQAALTYCKRKALFFVLAFAIILTLFRLYLYYKATYSIDMTAAYDDQLLIHYAQNLLNGDWLGDYNSKTLSKGISYSLFLVLANKLNLPYSILLGIFNILASLLMALSLRPIVKNRGYLFIVYLYFLFSPISFTNEYSTRIYRNAIVIPSVVVIVSCLLAIYFRKYRSMKSILPWMTMLAIIFPFYWFIREDSIWLVPFVVTALLISFIQIIIGPDFKIKKELKQMIAQLTINKQKIEKLGLFLLPVVFFMMTIQFLGHKNEEVYGLNTLNDRASGEFAQVMKNLIRLDDGTTINEKNSRIWVSREALNQAVAASPTFSKEANRIKELYTTHAWTGAGKVKELKGDIIFWALRDVISESGYYRNNAKQTNDFWKKVNEELAKAYETGNLKKKKEFYLMGTGDGKIASDVPVLLDFFKTAYTYNLFYKDFQQGGNYSFGTHDEVEQAQKLLRLPLLDHWINSEDPHTPVLALSKTAKIAKIFITLYQKTSGVILIFSLVSVLFLTIGVFYAKNDKKFYCSILVICLGLVLTQFLFLFGVSWFCSYSPEQKEYFLSVYTGAGIPIMQTAIILILIGMSRVQWKKLKNVKK